MRISSKLVLLLAFIACQPPSSELTETEEAAIRADVLDWSEAWLEGVNGRDPEGMAALFDSVAAHMTDGRSYYPTWDEMLAANRRHFSTWPKREMEWTNRRIDVLAPDIVLLVGQYEGRELWESGAEYGLTAFISVVLRDIDGEWKGIHAQLSGEREDLTDEGGGGR